MKSTIAALVLIGLLPSAGVAQTAWGDDGGCARATGQQALSDLVFVLWPDRIERWEATCQIVGFDGDINTRGVIETTCNGEGETWSQSYGITFVGEDLINVWPMDAPDYIFELRQCR